MALTNTISSLIQTIRGLIHDLQKTNGRDSFEYIGDDVFTISESFISSSSINVYVNGTIIDEDDWSFDSDKNQITIDFVDSSSSLSEGDIIIITYNYYRKWSDTEIEKYIGSALSYFIQYRYKKVFEIDDTDIIAINDENPETKELYFICLITALLIDPQNIEIDTPEFKLGRNREKSDQEQIRDAFRQFQSFTGEFTFNPTDYDCGNAT